MVITDGFARLICMFQGDSFCPPQDLEAALAGLPRVEEMPSPWTAWAAIGLLRYRTKKPRAGEFLESLLGSGWSWQCGSPPLDEIPAEPSTRDEAEWELCKYGNDPFLRHVETGDLIHVDVVYGPEVIRKESFRAYLDVGAEGGLAETRYVELNPSGSGFDLAMGEITASGLIEAVDQDNFENCGRFCDCSDAVAAFLEAWEDPGNRIWLGAVVNDWPAADEAAEDLGDPA